MSQKTAKTVTIKFLNKQNRTVKVCEPSALLKLLEEENETEKTGGVKKKYLTPPSLYVIILLVSEKCRELLWKKS